MIAQALFVGAVVFRGLIWQPVVAGGKDDLAGVTAEQRRYLTLLADVLRAALIVGALGALYLQSRLAGVFFWELFLTRWGVIWIVRAAAVFLAAGWMESLLDAAHPRRVWLGLGLGAALLLTTALTSHGGTRPGWAAPLADTVHLLATSVWAGGLLTPYGQTLLLKLLVVSAAFGFGVYNSLVTRRKLEAAAAPRQMSPPGAASNDRAASKISRAGFSVGGEAALVAGAIFFAAMLTNLPPATAQNPPEAATELALSTRAEGMEISGRMFPARLGSNAFETDY